jgi:hypothetical protein
MVMQKHENKQKLLGSRSFPRIFFPASSPNPRVPVPKGPSLQEAKGKGVQMRVWGKSVSLYPQQKWLSRLRQEVRLS